ncbi:uncharacterized protein LOC143857034 [Tasmannia lanceolata]|uniref:uncharacterized protein LOC143857034 n=1 Tax=Tasmannia lanceolata TaxID=3420 RepID=UPI0040642D86
MYLTVGLAAVSSLLIRQEGKVEQPIYYVSRVLHDAETQYQGIEKFAFTVVISACISKLTQSQSSPIKPRPAIKYQVHADFIAEQTILMDEPEESDHPNEEPALNLPNQGPLWMLYIYGSSNAGGSGAGLVIAGPDNFLAEYATKFNFKASNNEVEYEALIVEITLATELHANRVRAHSDSQLVVSQANGFSEAKEERMLKYLEKV